MSLTVEEAAGRGWISTTAAAAALGVHRTAINAMILDGRLEASRQGAHWMIAASVFERFRADYVRPSNVPSRLKSGDSLPRTAEQVLTWLYRWGEANVAELAEVVGGHEGNVRKGAALLFRRGLAVRDAALVWSLTAQGREIAELSSIDLDDLG